LSDEYEEVEVTDFRAVGIVAAILLAVGIVVGIFVFGDLNIKVPAMILPTDESIEEIIERKQEEKGIEPEKFFEAITNPFDHKQDTPVEETRSLNERLMKEFLSFGLEENDIAYVLADNCSKYINGTNIDERFQDIQFEKLVQVKTELCA